MMTHATRKSTVIKWGRASQCEEAVAAAATTAPKAARTSSPRRTRKRNSRTCARVMTSAAAATRPLHPHARYARAHPRSASHSCANHSAPARVAENGSTFGISRCSRIHKPVATCVAASASPNSRCPPTKTTRVIRKSPSRSARPGRSHARAAGAHTRAPFMSRRSSFEEAQQVGGGLEKSDPHAHAPGREKLHRSLARPHHLAAHPEGAAGKLELEVQDGAGGEHADGPHHDPGAGDVARIPDELRLIRAESHLDTPAGPLSRLFSPPHGVSPTPPRPPRASPPPPEVGGGPPSRAQKANHAFGRAPGP